MQSLHLFLPEWGGGLFLILKECDRDQGKEVDKKAKN